MRTFPSGGPISATLRLPAGACTVDLASGAVTLQVYPLDPGRKEDVEAAEGVEVQFSGGRLQVQSRDTLWRKVVGFGPGRLRVALGLPPESSLTLDTASASLNVTGGLGDLTVNGGSGDVTVDCVTGSVRVDTAASQIRLGQVAGDVTIDNGSGSADIDQVSGTVRMNGSSGDLVLGSAAGEVHFSSASGNLRIGVASGPRVVAKTSSGNVSMGVPSGIGVRPQVRSSNGARLGELVHGAEPGPGHHWLEVDVNTASGDTDIHALG